MTEWLIDLSILELRLGDYKLGLLLNFNVIRMMDGCRRVINGQIEA
jgi:hypothetical protein